MPFKSMPFSTPSICGNTGPWHQAPQEYMSIPAKRVFTGGSMATRNSSRSCAVIRPPLAL